MRACLVPGDAGHVFAGVGDNRMLIIDLHEGGTSTEDALEGVRQMNQMLEELGLENTYQNLPYEAGEYLIGVRKLQIPKGPARQGAPPYTEADPYVRTTPAEIGQLLVLIEQCSRAEGALLERYSKALSADECGEMLALLERNADHSRILAGLPEGTRVAHKSGWYDGVANDVGIVTQGQSLYVVGVFTEGVTDAETANRAIAAVAEVVHGAWGPAPATSVSPTATTNPASLASTRR